MKEAEFWDNLKHRLNVRKAGSTQMLILPGWCDLFTPLKYNHNEPEPRISGRVRFLTVSSAYDVEFLLHLHEQSETIEQINWETLIAPEGAVGWITFNPYENRIELRPPK